MYRCNFELSKKHKRTVHEQQNEVRMTHQFGVALGVEKEVLDRCLNYPPEQSIVEILDHWLMSKEWNWRDVARALRQIEHHQLAKEIENIDKTGHDFAN
jgi:hypothetical protein